MLQQLYSPFKSGLRISDSKLDTKGNTLYVVQGDLSEEEVISPNGYRYKKGFWDKVLNQQYVKDMIKNHECIGTIEHPKDDADYMKTSYEDASHVVTSVVMRNGKPYGKFTILNNPKGCSIKALIEVGVPVGVSTRGLGEIQTDEVSEFVSDENYALITWDFTRNPNFADKKMRGISDSIRNDSRFRELIDMRLLKDSNVLEGNKKSSVLRDIKRVALELNSLLLKLED